MPAYRGTFFGELTEQQFDSGPTLNDHQHFDQILLTHPQKWVPHPLLFSGGGWDSVTINSPLSS
jgi:hypothetical protein